MDFLKDIENRLRRYFSNRCWKLYGVNVTRDPELTGSNIVLSVTINSRVDTRNKVWRIWRVKNSVEGYLSKIPTTIQLKSENIPGMISIASPGHSVELNSLQRP